MKDCKDIIVYYNDDHYENEDDWDIAQDDWNYCKCEADIVLDANYVRVSGSNGTWQGTRDVEQIVSETTMEDIIDTYMNGLDRVECIVYADRVEFKNIHHDGTNSYTFTPFSFYDLTIKKLKEMIDGDEYNYDRAMSWNYFSNARKVELIEYIEGNM